MPINYWMDTKFFYESNYTVGNSNPGNQLGFNYYGTYESDPIMKNLTEHSLPSSATISPKQASHTTSFPFPEYIHHIFLLYHCRLNFYCSYFILQSMRTKGKTHVVSQ